MFKGLSKRTRFLAKSTVTLVFYGLLVLSCQSVFAANPLAPFTPNDNVLDPNCLPTDSNCYVSIANLSTTTISALFASTTLFNFLNLSSPSATGSTPVFSVTSSTSPSLFSMLANGEVGVGYTNPGASWSNEKFGVMNTLAGAGTVAMNLINNSSVTNTAVALDFTPNTNISMGRINLIRTNSNDADFVFSSYRPGANLIENMRIAGNAALGTRVSIGTSTLAATLLIQATSSINPFTIASSSGPLFTVLANGNIGVGTSSPTARLALHLASASTTERIFNISTSTNDSLFNILNNGQINIGARVWFDNNGALVSSQADGSKYIVRDNDGSNYIMSGGASRFSRIGVGADSNGSHAITIAKSVSSFGIVYGVSSDTTNTNCTPTCGNAGVGGFHTTRNLSSANTYLNSYGLNVDVLTLSGGATVTNNYGIYIANGSAGTNNYGIYQADIANKNYFAGNVLVGTSSPASSALYIQGATTTNPLTIASSTGDTLFTILANGNTGIGTSTPVATLSVHASTTASNDNVFFISSNVATTNDPIFRVTAEGGVFADGAYSGSGADLAEYYTPGESLEGGDVVTLSTTTASWNMREPGSPINTYQIATIRKAKKGEVSLGVISTNPGIILGGNTAQGVPVALSGRVPVKVTNENGNISIGDYLTLSTSTPGYAMKLTHSGLSLGKAISSLTSSTGTVILYVENSKNHTITLTGSEGLGELALATSTLQSSPITQITEALFSNLSVIKSFIAIKITAAVAYIDTVLAREVKADNVDSSTVSTNTICIGYAGNKTCLNKEQVDQILQFMNITSGGASSTGISSTTVSATTSVTDIKPETTGSTTEVVIPVDYSASTTGEVSTDTPLK